MIWGVEYLYVSLWCVALCVVFLFHCLLLESERAYHFLPVQTDRLSGRMRVLYALRSDII